MGERQYLDDSSVKIAWVGDKLDAKFRVVSSLKAVASRVRTNPNGELVEASCVVASSGSVRYVMLMVADLVPSVYLLELLAFLLFLSRKEVSAGRHFQLLLT